MALDQKYYSRYTSRRDARDAEDDTVLISRARDVISRATVQMPSGSMTMAGVGGWDAHSQSDMTLTYSRSWETQKQQNNYTRAAPPEDVSTRLDDYGGNDDGGYDDGYERKNRNRRARRGERRKEERKTVSDRPCRTILIKHLPGEVDENYLRGVLQLFAAPIQDVRLVKHKDSGTSRGFAFVEFQFLPDAQRWMEENQGCLVFGATRASLTYSKSRGDEDWFCSQCGTQNFKRRSNCFKCGVEKNESEKFSQISTHPTRIILLTGLDSMTTEDKIQKELHDITAIDMNIQLIKDPTTNVSRGLCYVALSTTQFSSHLLEILNNMQPAFMIDGKSISVHYCKEGSENEYESWGQDGTSADYYNQYYQQAAASSTDASAAGAAAVAAAAAAAAGAGTAGQYDQSFAGYSAQQAQPELSTADKVALAQEQVQAARKLQLEQQQVTQTLLSKIRGDLAGNGTSREKPQRSGKKRKVDLPPPGTEGEMSDQGQLLSAAALESLAQPPSDWGYSQQSGADAQPDLQHQTSTGSDGSYYQDTSQYQYDEASGFYYDPQTGLYYDPNSQYFYNAHSQQYMYWDGTQYVPAPNQAPLPANVGIPNPEDRKEDKTVKKEKGKVAKKVAADMRRWAASMNEMKNLKSKKNVSDSRKDSSSAAADAGFAVLSKKADPNETKQSVLLALNRSTPKEDARTKMQKSSITNILAQYGGDSDSEPEEDQPPPSKKQAPSAKPAEPSPSNTPAVPSSLTDWSKLICLLCKRQFPSREVLVKHQQFSDLHKQNLEALKKKTGLQSQGDSQGMGGSYRDRAQERRSRFSTQ